MDFHTLLYRAQKNNAKDKEVSDGILYNTRTESVLRTEPIMGRPTISRCGGGTYVRRLARARPICGRRVLNIRVLMATDCFLG